MTKPSDRNHLAISETNDDRRDACKIDLIRMQYRKRHPGTTTGIDGIAALGEDRGAGGTC